MNRNTVVQTIYLGILILALVLPGIPGAVAGETAREVMTSPKGLRNSDGFVDPIIHHAYRMDRDFDHVQDRLTRMAQQTLQKRENGSLPVIVTLNTPVTSQDLVSFRRLGGNVEDVYDYVTYGFSGAIPASNLSLFAAMQAERLAMIEFDTPLQYHLDLSTPLIQARPTVWDTYGYLGSPNHSIAILDTGIDDAHLDLAPYQDLNFSSKIVGWYDATADGSPVPEDYGEHGTHVAGIAAGTGAANNLQGSGTIQTTFTYVLPPSGYGYMDYIDVASPGVIHLSLHWNGVNSVLLRLVDPQANIVAQTIGGTSPVTLDYSTEGTAYPTGRYGVLVGNYLGPAGAPFSCVETVPYTGRDDGYALFRGVAPNVKLVGVKVFDNTGSGTLGTLLEAMDWIIEHRRTYHIVVASMSLSLENGATDTTLDQKVDTMVQNGIVTIVSAGNDFPDFSIGSPGTAAYVITVAATNDYDGVTGYSSNGDQGKNEYGLIKPDVAAPGGTFDSTYGNRIISADSNDGDGGYTGFSDQNSDDYQQMGGTSMSAPHVAGLAALTIQALGSWNWTFQEALKVKMLISMTAFETQSGESLNVPPLNRGAKDSIEGYGRVSADAAIEATTMTYSLGADALDMFGSDPLDKKVWARKVQLTTGMEYHFNLTVPVDADYDLYLYDGMPDSYGQPVIVTSSVNVSSGAHEQMQFAPPASGDYYVLAKWVSGDGNFTLSSASHILRDVAVTDVAVSDTVVYAGAPVDITVTVQNAGGVSESFNVTVFYNSTAIEEQQVSALAVGASEVLTFTWDTSAAQPCSNYTIIAEASSVPQESNTVNNVLTDGHVKVKMQGDVNGDGAVNVLDLTIVSLSYGLYDGEPGYNPVADITQDGLVDMRDLVIVARNLGRTCP